MVGQWWKDRAKRRSGAIHEARIDGVADAGEDRQAGDADPLTERRDRHLHQTTADAVAAPAMPAAMTAIHVANSIIFVKSDH